MALNSNVWKRKIEVPDSLMGVAENLLTLQQILGRQNDEPFCNEKTYLSFKEG